MRDEIKRKMRREKLVSRAISSLDRKKNLNSLSVRDICACAGISVGTFYYYFTDVNDFKQQILYLLDDYLQERLPNILVSPNPAENFRAYVSCLAEYTLSRRSSASGTISSLPIPLPSSAEEQEQEFARPFFQILFEILLRGQKQGVFSPAMDARAVTLLFIRSYRGFSIDWTRHDYSYDFAAELGLIADVFLAYMRRPPDAAGG